MHIHEYKCTKCLHKFLVAHPATEQDKHRIVRCPVCSGTHVKLCFEPLHPASTPTQPTPAGKEI